MLLANVLLLPPVLLSKKENNHQLYDY